MSDFPGSLSQGMQPSLYPFCSATRLTNFIRHEKLERKEPLSLLWLILSVRSRCLGIKKNVARDRQGKHRKRLSHNHAKFTLSLSLSLTPSLPRCCDSGGPSSPSASGCDPVRAHGEKGAYRNLKHGAVCHSRERERERVSYEATALRTMSSYLGISP